MESKAAPAQGAIGTHDERLTAAPSEVVIDTPAVARTFEQVYGDLHRLFSKDPRGTLPPGVTPSQKASELFAEMMIVAPDAGPRALGILLQMELPWQQPEQLAAHMVCELIMDFHLQRLTHREDLRPGRASFVTGVLGAMPTAVEFANTAVKLLEDKDHLEMEHEPLLLAMAREARHERAFLAEPTKRLLATLWKHSKTGEAELMADLLHYFEGGAGDALRSAATERLLLHERYRDVVIARLIERRDGEEIAGVAGFAAKNLPFDVAIDVIAALKAAVPRTHLGAAYLHLAQVDAAKLRASYERALGDANLPAHREQIVLALGNYASESEGIAAALLAFGSDPDVRVRGVALLAISNRGRVQDYRVRIRIRAESWSWPRSRSYVCKCLEQTNLLVATSHTPRPRSVDSRRRSRASSNKNLPGWSSRSGARR